MIFGEVVMVIRSLLGQKGCYFEFRVSGSISVLGVLRV